MPTEIEVELDSNDELKERFKHVIPKPLQRHYIGRPRGHRRVHFKLESIVEARQELRQLCNMLTLQEMTCLRTVFANGEYRSNRPDRSLLGIITGIRRHSKDVVMGDLGFVYDSTLDYWLTQICGGLKPKQDDFVFLTVFWLDQILSERAS